MKIAINGRFLSQPVTGVQRYASEIVKTLDLLIDSDKVDSGDNSFVLLSPKNIVRRLNLLHIPVKCVGYLTGHLWEQLELPFYAGERLLLNLCNTGPATRRNQIVTIHGASTFAIPDSYSPAFRLWYRMLTIKLCKTAECIITVSQFSRRELIHYCGMSDSRLRVIGEGGEHILGYEPDYSVIETNGLNKRPFALCVSSLSPHKNFSAIVKAIEILDEPDFDVAIVGRPCYHGSRHSSSTNVKYLGYVDDHALRALYEHAAFFVHPATYEGFGLTPLEAMYCGCPVIVSGAASIPEVCREAALYCNPSDPRDIAHKMLSLMADPTMREDLRLRGLQRAREFTWEKATREILDVCAKAAAGIKER